jgi:cellobiose PTS system EIIB component
MRVLLICAAGMSTSLLTTNMKKHAEAGDVIDAMPAENVAQVVDDYDVFLLGPQIRYREAEVRQKVAGKPVGVVEMRAYGTMDGKAAIEQARALLNG